MLKTNIKTIPFKKILKTTPFKEILARGLGVNAFPLVEFLACLILTSSKIQIKLHVPEKIMHKLVQLTFFSKT